MNGSSLIALAIEEKAVEALKDASHLYEVERREFHAQRPGFRINELQISKTQKVPWHYHSNVKDTFYVLEGSIRIFLQDPKEEVRLEPGETYVVPPRRPHLVTNGGDDSATFLVLQGIGEYDFVPLLPKQRA
jgi:quercetin dioxygenase-like cupin family protein